MKALIAGYDEDAAELLEQFGYTPEYIHSNKNTILPDCNLLVLTGGADVYPALYGQENRGSYYDGKSIMRDYAEESLYRQAVARNIPVFGICRGFQFINVMNRGILRQDISGHTGNYGHHSVHTADGSVPFLVNSYHHQQVVLGVPLSKVSAVLTAHDSDGIESCYFYDDNVSGVQWHPEWLPSSDPARLYVGRLLNSMQNNREQRINKS